MDINEEINVKDDLIKVLDTHVDLLKHKSKEQVEELSKNKEYKSKMLKNIAVFSRMVAPLSQWAKTQQTAR